MTRQDAAKAMLTEDIIGIAEAINLCFDETRSYFMLGGILYIATIISGAVDWCTKANICFQNFIDKELADKLRAKIKLYSSDEAIPLKKQKKLMSQIVSVEKQYWMDKQAESGKWCPKFLIPDVGAYRVEGHYIGNTLEYA